MRLISILFCFWGLVGFSQPAYVTFPSDIDWVTRSSAHFNVIFRRGQSRLAGRALVAAEKAYKLLAPVFPDGPDQTWMVLADFTDQLNGYALDLPYPHMVIFASPPKGPGRLSALDDWLDSVILHEYVHIRHIYPASGLWSVARFIFGSWVLPNALMPSHLHEGMATFLETQMSRGGRGRGSYFRMIRRVAVDKGVWGKSFGHIDLMDGTPSVWPQGASPYFYGYFLHEELWNRRKAKGFTLLTDSFSDNWPYFTGIPFGEVYGSDYSDIWADIFKKSTAQEKRTIAKIRTQPTSSLNYLTGSRFSKWDVTSAPDGKRIAFRQNNPNSGSRIVLYNLAKKRQIRQINFTGRPNGLCWGPGDRLIYSNSKASNGYRRYQLYYHNLKTKKVRTLLGSQKRISSVHALGCNRNLSRLIAYQEKGGVGWVREFKSTAKAHEYAVGRKWKVPEGGWVSSLAVGDPSWFVVRQGVSSTLYRWPNNGGPVKGATYQAHLYNLRIQSKNLYAIATLDGREEIWQLRPGSGKVQKKVALVGGLSGFDFANGQIIVSSYRHGGYDIARASTVKVATRDVPPVRSVAEFESEREPSNFSATEEYSPIGTLLPRAWVPQILIVPDGMQFGAWIPGFDISQKHLYQIFGGYDTRGSPFASVEYDYRFGDSSSISTGAYYRPSYIQSSQTFLKRWGAGFTFSSRWEALGIGYSIGPNFKKVDESPLGAAFQSVGAQLSVSKSIGFEADPLGVAPKKGTSIFGTVGYYFEALGSDADYISIIGGINQYVAAPWWDKHIFSLRLRGGFTDGAPLYNNFYEGGGELIFSQGRGLFLNRGFSSGLFLGRQIYSANLEYKFPLFRVDRGWGLFPAFLSRVHAAFVADVLTFDGNLKLRGTRLFVFNDEPFKYYYGSFGAEIISDWKLFFYLPAKLRMGIYHGLGDFGKSLKFTVGLSASL